MVVRTTVPTRYDTRHRCVLWWVVVGSFPEDQWSLSHPPSLISIRSSRVPSGEESFSCTDGPTSLEVGGGGSTPTTLGFVH